MEIQGSTEEHEHPDHGEGAQGNKQHIDHHTQLGAVVHGQRFQHSHLLQDHHGTVREQEAVPRDVEAVPDAAVLVALPLGGVEPGGLSGFALDGALPGEVLHVDKELGAQVPHGRAHQQRAQAPQHQQRALGAAVPELAPGQLVRGEGDEGQQQPQRPSPGHLHEVSARGKAEETQARVRRHSNGASGGVSAQGQCSEPSKLDLPSKYSLATVLTLSPVLPSSPKPEYFLRQVLVPKAAFPGTQSPYSLQHTCSSVLQSLLAYKPVQLCPTQNAAAKIVFLACYPDHSNPFSDSSTISIILAYKAFHNLNLLRQPEGLALFP